MMAMLSSMEQQLQDPTMAASLLAVALVTVILLITFLSRGSRQKGRLPPSPTSLPVIGHLHLVRPPVHRTFQELAGKLGPLMHIRLGSTHCVIASSADVASELIRGHEGKISERPLTAVARQFAYDDAGFAFAPYSPHWRFMKRLCMSELLGPRTVEQLRPIRRSGLASLLQAVLASSARGEAVDLTGALIRLSNTSIIRMMASTVPGSVTEEAQELVKAVAELVGSFNVEDYIAVCRGWDIQGLCRRAADVHRRFDALLEEMIRHKEEAREARRMRGEQLEKKTNATATESKDLLDILLDKAEEDSPAAEVKLTRVKINQGEDQSLRHRRGHGWLRHVGGDGRVDAGGADEPPRGAAEGAGGDRRGGRRGQDRRRGRRGEPAVPAGGVQGDAAAAAGGADRAPAVVGGDGDPRVHGAGADGCVHQPVGDRPRPRVLGGAAGVPAGAVHGRRRQRGARAPRAAVPVPAVRERPPGLPRHGACAAVCAGRRGGARAVLRLGCRRRLRRREGDRHGGGRRAGVRAQAPPPAPPIAAPQSLPGGRLAGRPATVHAHFPPL